MKRIISRIVMGITWGCTITTLIGLIGSLIGGDSFFQITSQEYIKQVLCSMIIGVGFSLPTIVYENDRLSNGIKILVHMGIGLTIYFIAAFYAGWIPTDHGIGVIISTILFMAIFSFAIWLGFFMYYKQEAKKINEKIKDIQK